ncbi:MAG: FHA domain-containing protein [Phycisphaerales bacterium]
MPALIVSNGTQEGLFLPLGKKSTVIGRDEAVPLQLEDERVSRKHCQVRHEPKDDGYYLLDMKSSNGTYLNNRRMVSEARLNDGDEIQLGDTKILFTTEVPTDKANALAVMKKAGERRRSTLMR